VSAAAAGGGVRGGGGVYGGSDRPIHNGPTTMFGQGGAGRGRGPRLLEAQDAAQVVVEACDGRSRGCAQRRDLGAALLRKGRKRAVGDPRALTVRRGFGTCPVSTEGGTRRVQIVRGEGGGSSRRESASAPQATRARAARRDARGARAPRAARGIYLYSLLAAGSGAAALDSAFGLAGLRSAAGRERASKPARSPPLAALIAEHLARHSPP